MSDEVQVVASNDVTSNPPAETEAEVNANQDASAVAYEEHADTVTEDDAELGEDEAGDSTTSVSALAKREAPVEEPYDFDRCTIQIGLQLLPDDGDPAGRPVVVGVRNHADVPIVALTRLAKFGPLPQVVTELLDRLRADLPMRQKAHEETAARKKAEEDAVRARREAARTKSKVSSAKPAPKKVNTLNQAPVSGFHT